MEANLMKKLVIIISSLAVMIFLASVGAHAQETSKPDPCNADIRLYCVDVQPGEGRIAACMQEHTQELSQACKGHIANLERNIRLFALACKGELQKFCQGINHGGGRLIFCLKDHEPDLSEACRTLLTKQYDKR
jgi:hypothetical protein